MPLRYDELEEVKAVARAIFQEELAKQASKKDVSAEKKQEVKGGKKK